MSESSDSPTAFTMFIEPKRHLLWSRTASLAAALIGAEFVNVSWWANNSIPLIPPLFVIIGVIYRNSQVAEEYFIQKWRPESGNCYAMELRCSRDRGSFFYTSYASIVLLLFIGLFVSSAREALSVGASALLDRTLSGAVSLMIACTIISALRADR